MPQIADPNVLVGSSTADDAGVYRLSADLAIVQTVDFITPVVDDPRAFGMIAAANSVSDVYAMGAKPVCALNVVAFPQGCLPLSVLQDILRGGMAKMSEAEAPVIGGHTIDDKEPKYGLAVTGVVHPDRILRNAGARPGDRLILTKPIGSGVITTAAKNDEAPASALDAAIAVMTTLNRSAAETAARFAVHACTDVTGFGLLGHLREMVAASGVNARVRAADVPVIDGAEDAARADSFPGGSRRNKLAVADAVRWSDDLEEWQRLLLCDAQTSGGLLLSVTESDAEPLLDALLGRGVDAAEIGEVTGAGAGGVVVE